MRPQWGPSRQHDAVYQALGAAFRFPRYFGNNPDALWDALGDYSGEGRNHLARRGALGGSAGPEFAQIVTVLQRAASEGLVTLELA